MSPQNMSLRVPLSKSGSGVTSPPSSTFSTQELSSHPSPTTNYSSPQSPTSIKHNSSGSTTTSLPNQFSYYSEFLNKPQFNLILINSSIKLIQILYAKNSASATRVVESKLRFFIIEILRRSKTSTQSLQLACFYLAKLIQSEKKIEFCPKKLFLTLIILASKFNQDHNYSFKSWLKICGEGGDLSMKELKSLEVATLSLLDYKLYLNNVNYENWCNILMIFSYDYIKLQKLDVISASGNQLEFETSSNEVSSKLRNWCRVFQGMDFKLLDSVDIQFKSYFNNQVGSKILIEVDPFQSTQVPSLFSKRTHEEDHFIAKKVKV
ncbi:hypothetical protein CLIB1423_04S06920 [[Candida] railenensis]|uniref:Cyclin N-terminal domain-containing protein n=1 Tax=[Candida] railenensis TaxID=45579 RepID=A0A9P0VWX7_9ASCO|nr:hypothetical protein CLIB1423_04S06920 [[Candida] railenensis]